MPKLGRDEYYPWFEKSSATLPKDRYLNVDFLKSEQQRIEEAQQWNTAYRAASRGDSLAEYITYVVPAGISKIMERRINDRGYRITGTSALRNNLQVQKLALFPMDLELPPDYSLIRVFEPKKEVVPSAGDLYGTDAIVVDDYERLDNDYIYRDLPTDDLDLFDLLTNNLGGDDLLADSVYSPMISSPPALTETGGIGATSLTRTTRFATSLNEQVAKMLPPEYTGYGPPDRDTKGFSERHAKGRGRKIVYHTAEKIPETRKSVGLSKGTTYRSVQNQIDKRVEFAGEYSYLGNIAPSSKRKVDVVQDTLDYFTQSEITVSSYDQLKRADVDLTRLDDEIAAYEDIWINVVDARQVMPSLDNHREDESLLESLEDDWAVFLPQMGYEDSPHQLSELRAEQTYENVLRMAQKIARGEKRERVTDADIKDARRSFKQQIERLLDTDAVIEATPEIKRNHSADREALVNTFLRSKPCTKDELISHLLGTRQFEKEGPTEEFVQRMIDMGYIYSRPDGKLRPA